MVEKDMDLIIDGMGIVLKCLSWHGTEFLICVRIENRLRKILI